jgi:hypothetical protein
VRRNKPPDLVRHNAGIVLVVVCRFRSLARRDLAHGLDQRLPPVDNRGLAFAAISAVAAFAFVVPAALAVVTSVMFMDVKPTPLVMAKQNVTAQIIQAAGVGFSACHALAARMTGS